MTGSRPQYEIENFRVERRLLFRAVFVFDNNDDLSCCERRLHAELISLFKLGKANWVPEGRS